MQLIRGPRYFKKSLGSVVTIGNFDGLHIGHQRLLKTLKDAASAVSLPSVLLTFEPNPKEFFSKNTPAPRLMRFYEKWLVIDEYDIDYVYCLRFNAALAALSPEAFVQSVLVGELGAKTVIVGDDFHFGAKRAGNAQSLKVLGEKYGFGVQALSQSLYLDERISSSRVRSALEIVDFKAVADMTGRPYRLSGRVAYGNQLGRQLGYPTANIHLHRRQVPLMGIFVVQVYGLSEKPLPGVASLGYRPTFAGKEVILEVHLFDFDQVIYGRRIQVEFLQKIRDEIKFNDVSSLILQMDNDALIAKSFFNQSRSEENETSSVDPGLS